MFCEGIQEQRKFPRQHLHGRVISVPQCIDTEPAAFWCCWCAGHLEPAAQGVCLRPIHERCEGGLCP